MSTQFNVTLSCSSSSNYCNVLQDIANVHHAYYLWSHAKSRETNVNEFVYYISRSNAHGVIRVDMTMAVCGGGGVAYLYNTVVRKTAK